MKETITDGIPFGWKITQDPLEWSPRSFSLLKDEVLVATGCEYSRTKPEWTATYYATDNPIAIAKIDAVLDGFREYKDQKLAELRYAIALSVEVERYKKEANALRVLM